MDPIRPSGYSTAQEQKVLEAAVDAGSTAVASLQALLTDDDSARRDVAIKALAYIGEEPAILALQREYERRPADWTKTFLCYAVSSRGDAADQEFLLRVLADRPSARGLTDLRPAAALALAVLRSSPAIPLLKQMAAEEPGTLPALAAAFALSWMTAQHPMARWRHKPQEAEIVSAVFAHGLPDRSVDVFVDPTRKGTWRRNNEQWTLDSSIQARGVPSMQARVHRAPDSSARAVVRVDFGFSRNDAFGYDYVSRQTSRGWSVRSVFWAWLAGVVVNDREHR